MEVSFSSIFDQCQRHQAHHKASVAKLRSLKDENPRLFVKYWLDLLNRILVQSKKHQSIERLVKFVALVAVSFDESFRDFTIQYVIRKTESRDWAPRFRACQILSQTLKALPEEAELGDSIWDEIYVRMRDRLDDRAPAVRAEAVSAIQRLQDPSDPSDPIITRFLEMMQDDPSGDVRKTVICNVAICKITLKEIVLRTRDVHAPARRAAFRVLANYVNIRNLKISQRVELLSDGLMDRDEKVKKECAKMCVAWLNNCDKDLLALLRLVDVEVAESAAEELLKVVFREVQNGSPVNIDASEKLTSEAAIYMRVISQFWKSGSDSNPQMLEAFETQVPELSAICTMMELNADNDFVLKQLLAMAALKDFSDEAGRVALSSLLRSLLPSPQVSQFLVEPIIQVLSLCHSSEEEFIQIVLEMLSDIREPLDMLASDEARLGFQKAVKRVEEMKTTYGKLKKMARILAQRGEDDKVAKAERKAAALRQDIDKAEEAIHARTRLEEHIWYRVLCVTELMLETTNKGLQHPGIVALMDSVLLPSFQIPSTVVTEKALRCLTMYCLLDRSANTVRTHISKILEASQNKESIDVRITAVKSLFDIGMLYGFSCLDEQDLIVRLSKYVTDETEDMQLRSIVVEGFSKLYLMGQCSDVEMLGHLLLLFFSPSTASDIRLRQCLSVFFPTYAFSSQISQDLCAKAAIPCMRRVLFAPASSSLRKIDWSLFCKFISHLVDPSFATYQMVQAADAASWHEELILQIAYEMRGEVKGQNTFWARALGHFSARSPLVEGDEEATAIRFRRVAKLYVAVTEAANEAVDKRVKQWTEKRAGMIREHLGAEPLSELLLREVSDELEVEMEEHLEARAAFVAQQLGGGVMDQSFDEANSSIDEEEEDERVKKAATRRAKRAVPSASPAKKKGSSKAQEEGGEAIENEEKKDSNNKPAKKAASATAATSSKKKKEAATVVPASTKAAWGMLVSGKRGRKNETADVKREKKVEEKKEGEEEKEEEEERNILGTASSAKKKASPPKREKKDKAEEISEVNSEDENQQPVH